MVASSTLSAREGVLTYKLPQTFSGPVYWKLELNANGLSDYAEGAFRVRDQQTVIRVLQVMPGNDNSSLLKDTNMTPSYLRTNDYNIQITPVLFRDFNTATNENSYAKLNGRYDMIIFGFVDNYNSQTSSALSDEAAAGVNAFIRTGQAVMFTHDTMIGNQYNPWIRNFQATTGQTGLYTNFGIGAPNISTKTKVVNTGMLTQFPFNLSATPTTGYVGQIAQTHDQYYMLDLEDPNVVPWYNIVSEDGDNATFKRDSDDSYDHYYTYSKGNVTYSGTGHTNTRFPEWEQKLFVNTMFRAFIGSNHAPSVTVISPTATETTKPSYLKDLVFSYQVDDLDLKDLNVYSTVKFKVNGQYVDNMTIAEKSVPKGSVITEKFANPLLLREGTIQIEITARDKQGATAVKTIDLTVQKVAANLLTERTLDTVPANFEFLTGSTVGMTYKVTPQSIPATEIRSGENGLQTLEISNVVYNETLPAGLELSGTLPVGMTKTGTLATGYTLSKTFDKITYTLSGSSYVPNTGSTFSFHLDTVPTKKGTYNLNQARLSYEDVHATDTNAAAIQYLKDYSFITLGTTPTKVDGFTATGRTAMNGNATFSSFNAGSGISGTNNTPTVITKGGFTVSGGSITNGTVMVGGIFDANGINLTTIPNISVVGDLKFSTNLSANGNNVFYGGTYSGPITIIPQKRNATTLKQQVDQAFDFAAVKTSMINLSNSYAAMAANGTKNFQYGTMTLTGTDPKTNVFTISGTETDSMTRLVVNVPTGSTAVINVTGTSATLAANTIINNVEVVQGNAESVLNNVPLIFNLNKQTTLNLKYIGGTVLAPLAAVTGANNVQGTLVADSLTASNFYIGKKGFAGAAPIPTPGEIRNLQFPDVYFNAIVKTKSISLNDQALWVGDSTVLSPNVLMTDGTTDLTPLLTWTSSDPSVKLSYPLGTTGGKSATVSVTGVTAGTAIITATASDGSGVKGTATVTVEAPALSIGGSSSINVGQTIQDIKATVNGSNLRVDNVTWAVISANPTNVQLSPQTDPTSLFVKGVRSGTVLVEATANITNTRTNTVRVLRATKEISIVDTLTSVVVNGPDTVKKGGTIDLSTVIAPDNANIGSVVWTITDGNGNAVLSPTGTAPSKTATLQGVAPGPVTVSVTVRTAGDNPIERTVTKTIWVLDFGMTAPDTVYVGDSINLTSSLLPINYPGTKQPVKWTVTNVDGTGVGTGSYAALGTATNNGNTNTLTGTTPGQVKVAATLTTPAGDFVVERIVTVKPVVTALLLPPTVKVEKGVPFDLIAGAPLRVNPISIPVSDIQSQLVWTSATPANVVVSPSGVVNGLQEGSEVLVTVTYKRTPTSPAISATTKVIVAKAADPNAPADGDRY
nr:DUF5057 domain-containing protein [Saccharibacillus sp. JS10]